MTLDYQAAGTLLERYASAIESSDGDAAAELFSEDCEIRLDPFASPLVGHIGLRSYLLQTADEQRQSELTIERHWVAGHTILASWHASHVRASDGARVHLAGFLAMEIANDGLVSRMRQWWNRREAQAP